MNRKLFWLGYVLAIGAVVWILLRQRQSSLDGAMQRLRETRPDLLDWQRAGREQTERSSGSKQREGSEVSVVAKASGGTDVSQGTLRATAGDQLEQISGIGPIFARRLREAGITRFAQLAALSEDEIRERISLAPWQGDVASWITQAEALVS